MNILIPDAWLREHLDTKAAPQKIAKCLSLCGASVERIIKENNDFIYDIEITSNRVDMAGVAGIAREAAAILPQFGIKAELINDPYYLSKNNTDYQTVTKIPELQVKIVDQSLCSRFTAVVLDNVKVKPSSLKIKSRLEKVGLRGLNNVIDISNYLMHQYGQPVHVFDYNKIKKSTMVLRESTKGEKIITLDGKKHILPGKDIVIEDGDKRLIDLCGIMGGENSAVDKNTTKVLLFVQNYEPVHIRKTSMALTHRSEAASLFEKNVDPKLVLPTILKGIKLLKNEAQAKQESKILDIYPNPYKTKQINIPLQLIKQYLGVPVQLNKVINILNSLGFKTKADKNIAITASVPSWRDKDINIPEDLIEEIARIYGFHNLPSQLPTGKLPKHPANQTFDLETMIKTTLVNWGFTEAYTYSMQSRKELNNFLFNPKDHLKISNPLTKEWVYMQRSLIPSLLNVISENQKHQKEINIFELANVYLKRFNQLPKESLSLVILKTGKDKFLQLKGVLETLFYKIGVNDFKLEANKEIEQFNPNKTAQITVKSQAVGFIGQISNKVSSRYKIKNNVYALQLNFEALSKLFSTTKVFTPLPIYPPVIEDLTFTVKKNLFYQSLKNLIKDVSPLIKNIDLIDIYKNNLTLRITYQHPKKNLRSKEVAKIRKKIISRVRQKGRAKLKGMETD